jgi:predicted DNA-binding transcriptional regulator YafY
MTASPLSDSALALWRYLDAVGEADYQTLCAHLGVTERQIRRLARELHASGITLSLCTRNRRRVFVLEEAHQPVSLSSVVLTREEAEALRVSAEAAQAIIGSTPIGAAARRAFARIEQALRRQPVGEAIGTTWYVHDIERAPLDSSVFAVIVDGLNTTRAVRIAYAKAGGEAETRVVHPLCIVLKDRTVVLLAWCRLREDYRYFTLARVQQAELESGSQAFFNRPADFDPATFFRPDEGGAFTDGAPDRFTLLVSPGVAHLFDEKEYQMLQQVDERRADGSIVVSYESRGFDEMRSFVQSWGTAVTALEPNALRQALYRDAAEIAERYAQPDLGVSDLEMSEVRAEID